MNKKRRVWNYLCSKLFFFVLGANGAVFELNNLNGRPVDEIEFLRNGRCQVASFFCLVDL